MDGGRGGVNTVWMAYATPTCPACIIAPLNQPLLPPWYQLKPQSPLIPPPSHAGSAPPTSSCPFFPPPPLMQGQLKLIDFGIAKSIQGDTTSISRESQVREREAGKGRSRGWGMSGG